MFSKVLDILDKPYRDAIYEYLAKNNKFNKTKEWLGLSIVLIIFMIFISILFFMKNYTYEPPVIYQVDKETVANNTYNKRLITLNSQRVTQQSLENWSIGFVNNMYNFDFNNFDKQLLNSKKYFTNAGYNAFVNSINKIALKEIYNTHDVFKYLSSKNPKEVNGYKYYADKPTGFFPINLFTNPTRMIIEDPEGNKKIISDGYEEANKNTIIYTLLVFSIVFFVFTGLILSANEKFKNERK